MKEINLGSFKVQLRQERTEERRKMFRIAGKRKRAGSSGSGGLDNNPFAKWKKLIQDLPAARSVDETKDAAPTPMPEIEKTELHKTRGNSFEYKIYKRN